jgi:hypothetical protein
VTLASGADLADRLSLLAFHEARTARSPAGAAALGVGLEELATLLLDPLDASAWRGRVRLVLDPDVPDLPWELLPFDGRPLAAGREVLRTPALGVRAARGVRAGQGVAVVHLGDAALPGARAESEGLAAGARRIAGSEATRAALARALRDHEVVHVAGHGFDAPEAPLLGGVRVADGWFTAADVPSRIGARTVVLAACRSGRLEGVPGQAWGGLPSALLTAGARVVLWTADDVEDRVTAELMRRFHRERRLTSVACALGRALEGTFDARGHAGGLLPFRISGVGP